METYQQIAWALLGLLVLGNLLLILDPWLWFFCTSPDTAASIIVNSILGVILLALVGLGFPIVAVSGLVGVALSEVFKRWRSRRQQKKLLNQQQPKES